MAGISFGSILLGTLILGLVLLALLKPQEVYKYFERKRYQYDVTLALYMLTPKERFVFNSILFISLTLLFIAAALYLPEHIRTITSRVFYYCFGDTDLSLQHISSTLIGTASNPNASSVVESTVRKSGDMARQVLGME